MEPIILGESLRICQINIEGASAEKSEYLSKLAYDERTEVLTVQETHIGDEREFNTRGLINGFRVAAYVLSLVYGAATYVRSDIGDVTVVHVSNIDNISNCSGNRRYKSHKCVQTAEHTLASSSDSTRFRTTSGDMHWRF